MVDLRNVASHEISNRHFDCSCFIPERAGGKGGGKEQLTMVHVLLLWQVGFFEVVIRQSDGRLHQRSSGMMILVGGIRQPLGLVGLAFGRL